MLGNLYDIVSASEASGAQALDTIRRERHSFEERQELKLDRLLQTSERTNEILGDIAFEMRVDQEASKRAANMSNVRQMPAPAY